MIIIGFSKSDKLAKSVAKKLKIKYSCLKIKKFPDKETYLKFTTDVKNKTVILFRTLNNPDEKIIELHNGEVKLESSVGKGTLVSIKFLVEPLAPIDTIIKPK